ncbi:hemerythrin domain-containing protein [Streptomyces lasiicapitis]|uniref:hemerythrin domain-containing protein n=1 Tax=Streptomyces lasiicapitis TaxID=1923961 RepID=UPI00369F2BB8
MPTPTPAPTPTQQSPREIHTLADKLLEVHDWLRGELVHLRAEAAAHLTERAAHRGPGRPPAPGLGLQIRQRCLEFCDALTFHHTSEDDHVFPGIAAHHPHLRPTLERLGTEHRAIARIKESLVALLADLATADPAAFLAEFDRMAGELTTHLEYEETWLVPVLAEVPFPPAPPGAGER